MTETAGASGTLNHRPVGHHGHLHPSWGKRSAFHVDVWGNKQESCLVLVMDLSGLRSFSRWSCHDEEKETEQKVVLQLSLL